jgi:hypothetical protein
LREVVDVSEAKLVGNILRIRGLFANRRQIVRAQAIRDAHVIQIGIADEGPQIAVVIFPAEAADARLDESRRRSTYRRQRDASISNRRRSIPINGSRTPSRRQRPTDICARFIQR